jgi:SAM-dependent methyltransferase
MITNHPTSAERRVLELGCGPTKRAGVTAIDWNPDSAADIIHDLNAFPYPLSSNMFDEIVCEHVLEHLDNLISVMEELHRVAKPGGSIYVYAPYFTSIFYYRDPTHRIFFSAHTFDYFIPGKPVHSFGYSPVEFELKKVEFPVTPNAGFLKRLIFRLINRHIDFYEYYFAFILPRHLIYYELLVKKPETS